MQMSAGHAKCLVESRESSVSPLATTLARAHVMHQPVVLKTNHALHCGRSTSSPSGRPQASLKCNNDCAIARRNARLADALGITAESREKTMAATYHDNLIAFAKANERFLTVVEKAFNEFVTSQKKTQVLPHMPPERRKFVQDLAAVYRVDTEMVDQEPNRRTMFSIVPYSVRLIRRLDTRIPSPLLSATVAASAPVPAAPSLGKLADLRSVSSWRVPTPVSHKPMSKPIASGTSLWRPRESASTRIAADLKPPSGSTSMAATRASSPAQPTVQMDGPSTPTAVPDSWEDDV
ncbi:hypothetical protein H0H93_000392 [Arthromyces matolae]|nr:hypothetical protein H0H93_000392 [Arthromyces matolae]